MAKVEPKPDYQRIWLQPNEAGWGEHTWCAEQINDDDIEYVRAADLQAIIDDYVSALVGRENGYTARDKAFDAICAVLGRQPTVEMDKRNRSKAAAAEFAKFKGEVR